MELETREKTQNPKNNIELSLGDKIEIIAPSNKFVNNQSFYIDYIDNEIIELININTGINHILKITSENNLSDESIEKIYILSKSEEEGYAKQNNLLPKTWIDIHIGGDIPEYITGQITNLEEDQIEVKILDDDRLIYIDFDYKGIPKNIPIKIDTSVAIKPISNEVFAPCTMPDATSRPSESLPKRNPFSSGPDKGRPTKRNGSSG